MFSQNINIENQNLYWIRYYNKLLINKKLQLHTEVESRRFANPDRIHQLFVPWVKIQYQLNDKVYLAAGGIYLLHFWPQRGTSDVEQIVTEIRPHQDFVIKQKKSKIRHRFMLEERFFLKSNTTQFRFNFRLRYQLEYKIPLIKEDGNNDYGIILSDELMFNASLDRSMNLFDQNHLSLIGYFAPSPNLLFNLGYINWFQQRRSGVDFFNRNILRFTVFHTFSLN
jgi:hypothetical protein